MNPPDDRADSIIKAALELSDRAAREAFLNKACQDDLALEARVRRLIEAREHTEIVIEKNLPLSPEVEAEMARLKPEEAGERIGRYRLLEQLGEGGFGVVWVAEQSEPVRRRVALKIIKLGMDTKEFIARFEQERQALAMMDHPNIARVFDAGATQHGRPFFVMELVRGVKITEYCDQQGLSMKERLGLFVQVCQAVQHAHQKGIIHRDLKPSNILVTINDGVPVPKVIDFGVAKVTQGRLTEHTVYTQFQQMVGTPRYMSPEQAEMTSLDIDTRSDIYSLGVLLYELLTGCTPIEEETLARIGLDEVRRVIREVDALRPSTRVKSLSGGELTSTAKRRQIEAAKLPSALRGDLDWIVMKAIEKDRTRRYETANGLALDLERYLNGEPVLARPPSKLYRFQKTVRRNKLAFTASAVTGLTLVTGAVVSSLQALRASRAEVVARRGWEAATRAQQQAEAINTFLREDVLSQATPEKDAPEPMQKMMKEILDSAADKLDHDPKMPGQEELEATLRVALGETYHKVGDRPKAEAQLRRAVSLRRKHLGPEHRDTLLAQKSLVCLLSIYMARWDDETLSMGLETSQGLQRLLDAQSGFATETNLYRAKFDVDGAYIWALANRDKPEEAARLKRQNLADYERVFGPLDHDSINALQDLAVIYELCGDFARAEGVYADALTRFEQTKDVDTYDGINCLYNLAWTRFLQGHTVKGETGLRDAHSRALRRFKNPEHPLTLDIQHRLARVLADQGLRKQAEELAEKTLAGRRRVLSTNDGRTAYTGVVLASLLMERGDLDRAKPLLTEARAVFRENYADQPRLAAAAENWLGALYLARGDNDQAEKLLLPLAGQFDLPTIQMSPRERRDCIGHIVSLFQALNQPDEAAKWQKKLDEISNAGAP